MNIPADILAQDRITLSNLAGKTFLITGGNGMLGRAFRSQFERYGTAVFTPLVHLPLVIITLGLAKCWRLCGRLVLQAGAGAYPDRVF